jgi:hypothetical protein
LSSRRKFAYSQLHLRCPRSFLPVLNESDSIAESPKDVKLTHKATLIVAFELTAPDGLLYLDDIKIVPQG